MSTLQQLRVVAKRKIAQSIVYLELEALDGSDLLPFTAGAHLQFELPGGYSRAYSLCNDPQKRDRYQIAVNLDPASRGGSRAIHEVVQVGHLLKVQGPKNFFPLDESAHHSILVAGGIGITPLISMALRLSAIGKSWELHYATRSKDRCAFYDELQFAPFAGRTHHYFDEGTGEKLNIHKTIESAPLGAHLYVCGPTGLIDLSLNAGKEAGWDSQRLHCERFSAAPVVESSKRTFKLVLARSGLTLSVPPERTAMSVILEAGIDLPTSCEQGVCGTCITDVIEGNPDHKDQCLDEAMRASSFTPCCSRSLDETLVIDL